MPEDKDLVNVLQALKEYVLKTIDTQFSLPRKLSDGTPVSGLSGYEMSALMKFLTDYAAKAGRFVGCYEFKGKASPYTVIMIGLLPLLTRRAKEKGMSLVWVSATGSMEASAKLNMMSLVVLSNSLRFMLWGDLVEMFEREPEAIRNTIVIGDADFEPNNTIGKIQSMNGSRHVEALQGIRKMAADQDCDLIVFHREALKPAFDLEAIGGLMAKRNTAPSEKKSGCFIATAAFDFSQHPDVETLRKNRDEVLERQVLGRSVICLYEKLSPPIARGISTSPWAQQLVRSVLVQPLAKWAAGRLGSAGRDDPGKGTLEDISG